MSLSFQEVHIENTNSCGYHCTMCPRESQTRSIGFMSKEDFALILDRLKPIQWTGPKAGLFHLHGFGEPLLDRNLTQKLDLLKATRPNALSLIYTTLGVRVTDDYFVHLLESGLTLIVISLYGFTQDDYKKIHGYDGFERVKKNLTLLAQAMKQTPGFLGATIKIPGKALSNSLPIAEPPEKTAFIKWVQSLGFQTAGWSEVHNYGDGRTYNQPLEERMCPVINGKRKNLLNITWDLNVIPCCFDYNASIPFGNLRTQSLEEIFSSPEYFTFLSAHTSESIQAYSICQNCEKHDL